MTRKDALIEQRKKINKSFSRQISEKDKKIKDLEDDLELHCEAVIELMDSLNLANKNADKMQKSINEMEKEFIKLKANLEIFGGYSMITMTKKEVLKMIRSVSKVIEDRV